jgi:hypothetical protein
VSGDRRIDLFGQHLLDLVGQRTGEFAGRRRPADTGDDGVLGLFIAKPCSVIERRPLELLDVPSFR